MFLRRPSKPVAAPTLVIWGERDPALGIELLEGLEALVPGVQIHRIPDASHWVQNEAPGEVNRALVDFLSDRS
jgi:pimeloyl-ACP methyl ester carboxylesterase